MHTLDQFSLHEDHGYDLDMGVRVQKLRADNTVSPQAEPRNSGISQSLMDCARGQASPCSRPNQKSGARESNVQDRVGRSEVLESKTGTRLETWQKGLS